MKLRICPKVVIFFEYVTTWEQLIEFFKKASSTNIRKRNDGKYEIRDERIIVVSKTKEDLIRCIAQKVMVINEIKQRAFAREI